MVEEEADMAKKIKASKLAAKQVKELEQVKALGKVELAKAIGGANAVKVTLGPRGRNV